MKGWLYLAVVIDLFSRRVVGWAVADHLRTELCLDALSMAIGRRLPDAGLAHHSDRGCQYASDDYRRILRQHGLTCSMSPKGNCWDNAVVESFFSGPKTEFIYRHAYRTHADAAKAITEWIEGHHNRHRGPSPNSAPCARWTSRISIDATLIRQHQQAAYEIGGAPVARGGAMSGETRAHRL